MLLNYFKLSLRLLARNPFFTFINVVGLSVGFASFFILWQHSSSELQSDQHHQDFDRIGRLGVYWRFMERDGNRGVLTFGGTRAHHGPTIAEDFPQVEQYVRILMQPEFETDLVGHESRVVVSVSKENGGRELFEETRMVYADSNLFSFFTLPIVMGEKKTILKHPESVVLSRRTARKYFGSRNPVGEMIQVNNSAVLVVTGVFEDHPHNSHLVFDLVASTAGIPADSWSPYKMTNTYIKLTPETTFDGFIAEVNKHWTRYWAAELSRFPDVNVDFFIQPLKDIAFSPTFERDYLAPKTKSSLVLMQFASLLILSMACINYNNLTASRMMKRMKEIATRKMTGGCSSDFARQFLVESSLVNGLAVAVAFTVIQLIRLPLSEFFRIRIPEFASLHYQAWILFVVVILLGILISGLYPTFISASFNPRVLYAVSRKARSGRVLQTLLSTTQYVMAMVLILWVYIVYLQLNFILGKDLGILRDQVIVIDAPIIKSDNYVHELASFVGELRSLGGVMGATYSETVIGDSDPHFVWVKGQSGITTANTNGGVDESFIPFYRIPVIAGRNFVAGDRSDVVILSPQATRRLGFAKPEDAVGQLISVDEFEPKPVKVIGIISDYRVKPLFNLASTASENEGGLGICLFYKNGLHDWRMPERVSLRVEANNIDKTMDDVGKLFQERFKGNVLNWYFLDDHINKAYEFDKISRNQIGLFTIIAIGLSCMGVLGLMATMAEEKVKEIGIRKVLGAGAGHIVQRLIRSLFLPVVPAVVIAIPVGYYLADEFLNKYMERVSIQWWHFAAPTMVLIVIVLGTVSVLVWQAARANPVEALKHE